uniref:Uncharacterized protein n=1 Tax=Phytophthora fragariae TaxID=53985 RepID=A0A6A3DAP4_9STRA|nr:hypothetical protein PF009_g31013 [Phytophthora fragariae]
MRPVDACEATAGRPSRRRTSCSDTHGASTARAAGSELTFELDPQQQSCELGVETPQEPRADDETDE